MLTVEYLEGKKQRARGLEAGGVENNMPLQFI